MQRIKSIEEREAEIVIWIGIGMSIFGILLIVFAFIR